MDFTYELAADRAQHVYVVVTHSKGSFGLFVQKSEFDGTDELDALVAARVETALKEKTERKPLPKKGDIRQVSVADGVVLGSANAILENVER